MNVKKYVVEFIGTFFLVLTVGCTVMKSEYTKPENAGAFAGLAIGCALMVMIFAGGHISGGHYNPAVTLAVWMRGRLPILDLPFYMVAQVLGAVAAAYMTYLLKDFRPVPPAAERDGYYALLAELLFTFALCYVVLNVATAKGTSGNSFYGLAIGFTVVVGAYAVGPISGGAFNPAVATGITVMSLSPVSNFIYLLGGEFLGAALAALVFRFVNEE